MPCIVAGSDAKIAVLRGFDQHTGGRQEGGINDYIAWSIVFNRLNYYPSFQLNAHVQCPQYEKFFNCLKTCNIRPGIFQILIEVIESANMKDSFADFLDLIIEK